MSIIEPNGNIWVLRDIPLDSTYQHTLYWPVNSQGRDAQMAYFLNSARVVMAFSEQTYSRVGRGKVRVSTYADALYSANYIAFRNTNFSQKMFYAFIKSIDYINNHVTEISYEIDVIQTWYFDYALRPCLVERTHTDSDVIGENIVPEPVEIGELIYPDNIQKVITSDDLVVILAIVDITTANADVHSNVYGHIFGAATLKAFNPEDIASIDTELNAWANAGKSDAVVSVYLAPKWLITGTVPTTGSLTLTSQNVRTAPMDVTMQQLMGNESVDGYTPHNKKLYTYPYNQLEVFTAKGASLKLRYEFFKNRIPKFKVGGCITTPVELTVIPFDYKNPLPTGTQFVNQPILTEALRLTDYPLCSWATDTYRAWVAQNSIPYVVQTVGSMIGTGVAGVIYPRARAFSVGSLIGTAASAISEGYKASIAQDNMHGNVSGSSAIAMGYNGLYYARSCVTKSMAQSIDSFFDVFGYAVKKILEPVRKNRKYYTYVKTLGCVITESNIATAGIPVDDANMICKLHDNGITYWDVAETTPALIGDYALASANRPLSELNNS